MNASQLASLFQNLGHPLPYDKLTKIMSEYDVSNKGQHSMHSPDVKPQVAHMSAACVHAPPCQSVSCMLDYNYVVFTHGSQNSPKTWASGLESLNRHPH